MMRTAASLHFRYRSPGFGAETRLTVLRSGVIDESTLTEIMGHLEGLDVKAVREAPLTPVAPRMEGDDLVWDLELGPREFWGAEIRATLHVDGRVLEPMHDNFAEERKRAEGALTQLAGRGAAIQVGKPDHRECAEPVRHGSGRAPDRRGISG